MDYAKISINELGFDKFFESNLKELEVEKYTIARVIAEYKEAYRVISNNGEFLAKITGKQIFNATKREDYPAVGDWILITELNDNKAIIHQILPRKTLLEKKYSNKQENQLIATNIDTAFIIESVDRDFNLNRFERYLIISRKANIIPVFILNKIDLISKTEINNLFSQVKSRFNKVEVILTSTKTEAGINNLIKYIKKGQTYCFLGSSGVGKSSLVNALLGKNIIKTQEINTTNERGRHTTSVRELYLLKNGGIVIDNPGTREVGISDSYSGIENVYNEITDLSRNCKFSNCTHTNEPECAILAAIANNLLDINKFDNYLKLKKESEYFEMNKREKRLKDRKFGIYVKKYFDNLNKEPHI
ncbi:ribosome small subunit-dependent GTPase A [Candidatus Woesebacteria bacterium]|nr:MAG: ribosome small subunit-dependent GTPase A [Candidatus Woesebacteria bacterium]